MWARDRTEKWARYRPAGRTGKNSKVMTTKMKAFLVTFHASIGQKLSKAWHEIHQFIPPHSRRYCFLEIPTNTAGANLYDLLLASLLVHFVLLACVRLCENDDHDQWINVWMDNSMHGKAVLPALARGD
jgi:hypothetical protein